MASYYKLADDGVTPVPCNMDDWNAMLRDERRRFVARDTFTKPSGAGADIIEVSTVFLGMDLSLGYNPVPLLWETMLFGDIDIGEKGNSWRHTSRQNAMLVHEEVVSRVRSLLPDVAPEPGVQEEAPTGVSAPAPKRERSVNLEDDC